MREPTDPYGQPPPAVTGDVAGERTDDVTTGHPAVDTALREVRQMDDVAPADQIPTYQAAHRALREVLASIDEG